MCGIYGYVGRVKPGMERVVAILIEELAISTEVRGIDSAGFFMVDENQNFWMKQAIRPRKFIKNVDIEALVYGGAYIFVGHNRAASIGTVNNDNAHPFDGRRFTMVHNGTVRNARLLAKKHKVIKKMEGTTDSEVILRCIDKKGKITKQFLAKLNTYSIVILDKVTEILYFARDNSRPMFIADMRDALGVRFFASTKEIMVEAFIHALGQAGIKLVKGFYTRPYHLYSVDWQDGEFYNKGRYRKPPLPNVPKREDLLARSILNTPDRELYIPKEKFIRQNGEEGVRKSNVIRFSKRQLQYIGPRAN